MGAGCRPLPRRWGRPSSSSAKPCRPGPTWSAREIAADLGELRDRLPALPGEIARRTVADQLDREVEEMFASLEDQPVAAASIAQVHFGTSADGSHVAVKILRPGIEEKFARDIDLFLWVAEWL